MALAGTSQSAVDACSARQLAALPVGLAVKISGKHRSLQANSIKYRRVLSFNYLGMRLCRQARLTISSHDIQAAIRQIMTWADECDWNNIKSVSY